MSPQDAVCHGPKGLHILAGTRLEHNFTKILPMFQSHGCLKVECQQQCKLTEQVS